MKKQKQKKIKAIIKQKGMALIASMMCLLLLSGLGMAVLFNASGDVAITGSFRRNEQAFFAADAGIGLAREVLRVQLNSAILSRAAAKLSTINFTAGQTSFNHALVKDVLGRKSDGTLDANLFSSAVTTSPVATTISTANQRGSALGANRNFNFGNSDITLTLDTTFDANESTTTNPGCTPGDGILEGPVLVDDITYPRLNTAMPRGFYYARYRYEIISRGNFSNAAGTLTIATATAREIGFVTVQLNPNVTPGTAVAQPVPQPFSSYGSFYNRNGFTSAYQFMSGGTYTGPTHINQWFRFYSGSINYRFKDAVTQGGSSSSSGAPTYQYGNGSTNTNYTFSTSNPATSPGTNLVFESTFAKVDTVAIPTNTYNQQISVLDGVGLGTTPTAAELGTKLSKSDKTHPDTSTGLPDGVYLSSSDNSNITGGGIYVKGNVSDMKLYVDNGKQVYEITQGTTTTKITVDITNASTGAGTTKIKRGSDTEQTFTGVPMDKRDSSNPSAATMLYVDGVLDRLHGPSKSGSGSTATTAPAIAANTKLTITGTSDIVIAGDLKYTNQTVNNDGTPVTANQNATNILGIYTAAGKVVFDPEASWTAGDKMDLTIDAAITAFNEPALTNASTTDDYTGGRGDCTRCTSNGFDKTKATLYHRGSEVYSQDLLWTRGFGSSGSRSMNIVFDQRLRGGAKAPPWFPGSFAGTLPPLVTSLNLAFTTSNVASESNTWQRVTGN